MELEFFDRRQQKMIVITKDKIKKGTSEVVRKSGNTGKRYLLFAEHNGYKLSRSCKKEVWDKI